MSGIYPCIRQGIRRLNIQPGRGLGIADLCGTQYYRSTFKAPPGPYAGFFSLPDALRCTLTSSVKGANTAVILRGGNSHGTRFHHVCRHGWNRHLAQC